MSSEFNKLHQQVLDKLNTTADAIHQTQLKLQRQAELVFTHNADELSHPYILALIKQLSALTPSDVAIAIANHNNSIHAHPDIRLLIEGMLSNNGALYQLINAAISAHNTSAHAHEDIRVLIAEGIGGSTIIRDIQNQIAALQAKVNTNTQSIEEMKAFMTDCCNKVNNLISEMESLKARVTALELKVSQLEGSMGSVDTIDMSGFIHNLPQIVLPGSVHNITFSGVTEPGVKYAIIPRDTGMTFSKSENINNGEQIEIKFSPDSEPASFKRFAVVATAKDKRGQRTITAKINSAPNITMLTTTLPQTVEPGKSYEFIVSGATDVDGQAITYSITTDPVINMTFSKTENITASERLTLQVNSDVPRGTGFVLKITAKDTLNATTTKNFPDYSVNIAPDVSNLFTTLPSIVKPHDNKSFTISGARPAPGGSNITYKLASSDPRISFSKATGITDGENITITVATGEGTRGEIFQIFVSAVDNFGAVATVTYPLKINKLPDSSSISTSLPASTPSETTIEFIVSGGLDPDDGKFITYFINPAAGLTFSKNNGFNSDEKISVQVAKVLTDSDIDIEIFAVDSLGEKSATPKIVKLRALNVVPHLVTAKPTILYPTEGDMSVPPRFIMRISPYSAQSSVQTVMTPPHVIYPYTGSQKVNEDFTLIIGKASTYLVNL